MFEHFLPLIRGKRVVIVKWYPGISQYQQEADLTILERQPTAQDLPDTTCEYLLADTAWVFLTATSIANKTVPQLVEPAQSAELVLMGPTVPWLHRLACIIHEPSRKTLEIHIQRGFRRFFDFDSVFLYTKSEIKRAEGFEICPKSW